MSVVIKVENVSKLYRLGEIGTGSIAHDVNRWWHKMRGNDDPYLKIGQVNERDKKSEVRSQTLRTPLPRPLTLSSASASAVTDRRYNASPVKNPV